MTITLDLIRKKGNELLEKEAAPVVQALVIGKRASRKSGSSIFTWGDKKVFAIVGSSEAHGLAAKKYYPDSDVVPIEYDRDLETGELLPPAKAVKQLEELLKASGQSEEFDVVVFDGLTHLDQVLQNIPSIKNNKDRWAAMNDMEKHYNTLMGIFQELRESGKHCVVTMASRGFTTSGKSYEVPELFGKMGLQKFAGDFADILFVKMDEEEGEAVFDFSSVCKKTSEKKDKKTTEIVEINPRLKGVNLGELEESTCKAEFSIILEAKERK